MQRLAITAESYRAVAEGDQALAEAEVSRATAEKLRAEAAAVSAGVRINGARVINNDDDDAESEAYAALSSMAKQ